MHKDAYIHITHTTCMSHTLSTERQERKTVPGTCRKQSVRADKRTAQ
jgi:hypothetical protein